MWKPDGFNKAHLQEFSQVLRSWMIIHVPGETVNLDQLICDGKTLRSSAVETEDGNQRFVARVTVYARTLGIALAQKSYDTHESREDTALTEMLSRLDPDVVRIQPDAIHATHALFAGACSFGEDCVYAQVADVLLSVKLNQKTLDRQIGCKFQGKRKVLLTATDHEKRHGRDTTWELRASEAAEHIKANWPGSTWIAEVITDTTTYRGKNSVRPHLFLTSIRTTPDALLRLIRQR